MKKIFLTVLIAVISFPFAYSQTEVNGILNVNTPQSNVPLIKQDRAKEKRMIEEQGLYNYFTVKVTTTKQKKFDTDSDGYLSGNELKMYLSKCYR
jgi:uncharacterized membrane protein